MGSAAPSDERSAAEREERQEEARGGEGDREAEDDLDQAAEAAGGLAEGQRQAGDDDDDHGDDLGDRPLDRFQDLVERLLPRHVRAGRAGGAAQERARQGPSRDDSDGRRRNAYAIMAVSCRRGGRSRRSGRDPSTRASSVSRRAAAAAGEDGDELDGLGDQRARDGDDGLLDELLEPAERAECAEPAWMVPMPPGWPVPQAFKRSSASAPRTSPIGMRSGRSRSDERTRSESDATPSLVRSATRFGAAHCSSRVSSISTTRSAVLATSASSALASVVLPVEVPPATRMLRAIGDGGAQRRRPAPARHDAGGDIVVEGEHRDGGLADGEGGRRHDGRQQTLEALAGFGQLGRYARAAGVHLGADMMRDEPDDAFGIGWRDKRSPVSTRPPASRSIQSRPSGLSITSTTAGSSS